MAHAIAYNNDFSFAVYAVLEITRARVVFSFQLLQGETGHGRSVQLTLFLRCADHRSITDTSTDMTFSYLFYSVFEKQQVLKDSNTLDHLDRHPSTSLNPQP